MYTPDRSKRSRQIPSWFAIPPAGSYPPLYRSLARLSAGRTDSLAQLLADMSGAGEVIACSSGKAALYRLLLGLKLTTGRNTALMGSYTCPDVVTATLRAGFEVKLLPTDPETLEPDFDERLVDPPRSVLILSNLYGLPDRLAPWAAAQEAGLAIIDDACQSFRSAGTDGAVGVRPKTFGVLSFGRGKAICGIGGGAIVLPPDAHETAESLEIDYERFVRFLRGGQIEVTLERLLRDTAALVSVWLVTLPPIFALIRNLPALHVGETVVTADFPDSKLSWPATAFAKSAVRWQEHIVPAVRERTRGWLQLLHDLPLAQPFAARAMDPDKTVMTRYPIIFRTVAAAEKLLAQPVARQLGVSRSYPSFVGEYPELKPKVAAAPFEGDLPRRIATLPVHPRVSPEIQRTIRKLLETEGVSQ